MVNNPQGKSMAPTKSLSTPMEKKAKVIESKIPLRSQREREKRINSSSS